MRRCCTVCGITRQGTQITCGFQLTTGIGDIVMHAQNFRRAGHQVNERVVYRRKPLLNQAGAANCFLKLFFAAPGHLRGGPAKAAVIATAGTGLIPGSSIANVATTGTFTIPLMKKFGFPAAKAGAVAFLMMKYMGVSYVDVVKTAIVPAAISEGALVKSCASKRSR